MKKLFSDTSDVPQSVGNKAVRIVEKHLRQHKVDRANDLPEEAKVRLLLDLRSFFENGSLKPGFDAAENKPKYLRLLLKEMMEDIKDIFNFLKTLLSS